MSRATVRLATLAGAAAVALGLATPAAAAAAEYTSTVHTVHATATPVTHAGRTVTVTMPTTHYTASPAHSDAVATLAVAPPAPLTDTLTGQPGPTTVTPAYADNVSASGGTIGVGVTATLLLLVVIGFGVKNSRVKASWAVLCAVLGVFLGSTIFGSLSTQLGGTVVTSLSSILDSL